MNEEMVVGRLKAYVVENFLYARPDFELEADTPLIQKGIIDSMGVMELIEFINDEWSIQVEDEEITQENLGTLGTIARFLAQKTPVELSA